MRRESALDLSDVQRRYAFIAQAFHEVSNEAILSVGASVRAFAIQAVDALAGLALVFETRLGVRDTFRGSVELLEQVSAFVQEL